MHGSLEPVGVSHSSSWYKKSAAMDDLEWQMQLVLRFAERKALSSAYSMDERGYILDDLGFKLGRMLQS